MYNNPFDVHRVIDEINNEINNEINKQIEYERRKDYEHHRNIDNTYDDYDYRFRHKIDSLEDERRRMIERILAEAYHQQTPTVKKKIDITKDEIADAIDDFYEKEGLSKNDEVDIIVRKVGKKYVATIDKRRDQKIKEILDD